METESNSDISDTVIADSHLLIAVPCVCQAGSDLYAFVEFAEHRDAQLALTAMNKRVVLGRVC